VIKAFVPVLVEGSSVIPIILSVWDVDAGGDEVANDVWEVEEEVDDEVRVEEVELLELLETAATAVVEAGVDWVALGIEEELSDVDAADDEDDEDNGNAVPVDAVPVDGAAPGFAAGTTTLGLSVLRWGIGERFRTNRLRLTWSRRKILASA